VTISTLKQGFTEYIEYEINSNGYGTIQLVDVVHGVEEL
jgi:hypothetical protein